MAVISLALLIASSVACESAVSAVGVAVGVLVSTSGGGDREREGGDQGGEAARDGVHGVVSLRGFVVVERLSAATGVSRVPRGR